MKAKVHATQEDGVFNPTRADFLKGVGAIGAIAAGSALLNGCTTDTEADSTTWAHETDVVVVGSGVGGLTAAIRAAEAGARVIVVEVDRSSGGGSVFSQGLIHAMGLKTVDEYMAYAQDLVDPELGKNYFENFLKWMDWMRQVGLSVTPSSFPSFKGNPAVLNMGQEGDKQKGCRVFFLSCEKALKDNGGTILFETRAHKILTDDKNTILGIRCTDKDGKYLDIKCNAVVLSAGGFQANQEMRVKYFGPDADMATILGTPHNAGDGHRMAQEMGGALTGAMSQFSAILWSAYPAQNPQEDVATYESAEDEGWDDPFKGKLAFFHGGMSNGHPPNSIWVNMQGKRFIDESELLYRPHQAMAKQKHACAVIIFDGPVWDSWSKIPGLINREQSPAEMFKRAEEWGGRLIKADTIEALADELQKPSPYAVDREQFLKTMREYNEAVKAGRGDELDPPRRSGVDAFGDETSSNPIETGPFYAWPVRPAIYSCFGGIAIDVNSQVVDGHQKPIPGLFATTPCAGGIMHELYTGAQSVAGSTGFVAGEKAAAAAKAAAPAASEKS